MHTGFQNPLPCKEAAARQARLVSELCNRQAISGCFFSDLHLFSPRSAFANNEQALHAVCQTSELLVLGGDIFDLRWTSLGSLHRTIEAATDWLLSFSHKHAHAQIVYLLGNHDSHPELVTALDSLTAHQENLIWLPEQMKIGDCFFLHGDILDAQKRPHGLATYRRKFHGEETKSLAHHRAYDVAVAMRLHKFIPKLRHIPRNTCRQLYQAIVRTCPRDEALPQKVFFGHTHVPMRAFRYGQMEFYNPGASLKHIKFTPIKFSVTNSSDPHDPVVDELKRDRGAQHKSE